MRAGSMRPRAALAVISILGVLPVLAGAGSGVAGANPALCGMVVTQSTTLNSDVGPCDSTGIVVGANNIVLDLGGHRVFARDEVGGEGVGILLENRTGVTVRNGTVQYFDAGVSIEGGSGNTIFNIRALDNAGNAGTDYGDGIAVFASSRNRIANVTATGNGPYGGIDLIGNSDFNVIEGSTSSNNAVINSVTHHGGEGTMEDDGIRLEALGPNATPDNNVVRGNTVTGNGLDGIAVFPGAKDNQILGNTVHGNGLLGTARNGDGIHIFGFALRTLVQGNNVQFNARHGIRIDPTASLSVQPRHRILGNVSINNAVDPPVEVEDGYDVSDGNRFCDQDLWQGNQHVTEDPVPGIDCYN